MSKQANTKLIGAFVVGATVLVVAGILIFGSGRIFSQQRKFVLFFDDSVKGLSIGAPVDFRGVKVGTVTDVKIVLDENDLSLRIPVFIEIKPERFSFAGSQSELRKQVLQKKGWKTYVEMLIDQGLRAQLVMQSFVTGQLGIHLDFFPDKPIRLVGTEPDYTEIPTVESSLSEIAKTLQNIPVEEIAEKVSKTLDGIEKLVNSPDLQKTIVALHETVNSANSLLQNLDGQVKPLATGAGITLGEARKMFENAGKLARELDARIPVITAGLEETFKTAGMTMQTANKAIDGMTGDNSPVRLELLRSLNELSSAARSLRVLADYIENHPEALVRGKGK
jgi:paraquat-inducible protein B